MRKYPLLILFILSVSLTACFNNRTPQPRILSGPMPGASSHREVTLVLVILKPSL